MKPILLLALLLFLFLIPSVQAITIQQGVSFNTTNTTYIAGANFTVDSITVTQNILNITNSSTGDFIISATPSSGSLNITILGFNASYKKFNISSNTSGITASFVIGNITPVSALMVFLKNGAYWNTFASNALGYINFTYNQGYSNIQFEALQDTTPPAVSLSLSSASIYAGQSITITCSASDNYQVSSTSLTVTKPGNSQVSASCGQAFTDTSATGTYTVTYSATDTSGNSASTSQAFTVNSYGGGSGGTAAIQNKVNQTTKNVTVTAVPATANITNTTTTPQEPEIKIRAHEKINEVKAKAISAESLAKLSEAEAAYASGDYSRAYSLAVEAEGAALIGAVEVQKEPESQRRYVAYVIALSILAVGLYAIRKRDIAKSSERRDVKERNPYASKAARYHLLEARDSKVAATKFTSEDNRFDDIQKRIEEIKKRVGG